MPQRVLDIAMPIAQTQFIDCVRDLAKKLKSEGKFWIFTDLYFNKTMNDVGIAIDVSEESSGQGWYRGVTGCGWLVEIRQSAKHQK